LSKVKTTIDYTAEITGDLASMTKNIESGKGTIGKLIMDQEWRQKFESTFTNLENGSDDFRTLMAKANDIDDLLLSIKETMANTSNITKNLASITNNLESGNGTVGRLLMDPTTANNIDSTFISLKDSAVGLKLLMEKAKRSWLLWGF